MRIIPCVLALLAQLAFFPSALKAALLPPIRPTNVLEILGDTGTEQTVTVIPPRGSVTLWLRLNQLRATNEASISVNSGSWIPLDRAHTVPQGAAARVNGIGGPLEVLAVTVPSAYLTNEYENTITFKLAQSDGISSGYRVLEINFLDVSGQFLFARLPQPQPPSYPSLSGGSASTGSNLWFTASLKSSWSGTNSSSHCTDCHAEHGEDLRYFGYSDFSIYQRSLYHGLSTNSAKDLVAYINSLPEGKSSSPWHPPYQPGPGLDSRAADQWAAGAGMDWVLEKDSDTFKYLFGTNAPSFTFTNTINMRELPVAVELPSWNEWVPLINPAEHYGQFGTNFEYIRYLMQAIKEFPAGPEYLHSLLKDVLGGYFSALVNDPSYLSGDVTLDQAARHSLYQWRNLKVWDIVHARHWEDQGTNWYPWVQTTARTWPDQAPFLTSPNLSMPDRTHLMNVRDGSDLTVIYEDQKWNWLALVLNDSQHHNQTQSPLNFGQLQGAVLALSTAAGDWPLMAQQTLALVKSAEAESADQTSSDNWFTAFGHFHYLVLPGSGGPPWTGYEPAFANSILDAWFSEWENWVYLLGRSHFYDTGEVNPSGTGSLGGINYEDQFRSNIASLRNLGASTNLLGRMKAVGAYLWPGGDWTTGLSYAGMPAPARPQYAVEVLGNTGTQQTVSVVPPAGSVTLWLRLNHITATNQASLSINSGSWIPLDRSTTVPQGPAARLKGIGGPLEVMAVTVPSATFTNGVTNTFTFKLAQSDEISLGYRVLEINFQDVSGQLLFPHLVPVTPEYPSLSGGSASNGSNLWFTASLKTSWSGTNTTGHCTDCHTKTGSDLRYFGFSDLSIYERSLFHGLTNSQAKDLVAYINSLPDTKSSYPWNPPFQPGPGMDSRPGDQWAAGAGIDWVLEKDSDSLGYLFGTNAPSFTFTNTINARELPVIIELPSWNEWVPLVNLDEFYGQFGTNFANLRDLMAEIRDTVTDPQTFINDLRGIFNGRYSGLVGDPAYRSGDKTMDQAALHSLAQWRSLKIWDILHARHWEEQGAVYYRTNYPYWPQAVDRVWPDANHFFTSPNFTMPDHDHLTNMRDGTGLTLGYIDQQWYWLSLVLNDAQHHRMGTTPIDWGYFESKVWGLSVAADGWPLTAQQIITITKAAESSTADQSIGDNWYTAFGNTLAYLMLPGQSGGLQWTGYDPAYVNTTLDAWFTEWEHWIYSLERSHYITTHEVNGVTNTGSHPDYPVNCEIMHRSNIISLKDLGASTNLLTRMRAVGSYLWTAGDWTKDEWW